MKPITYEEWAKQFEIHSGEMEWQEVEAEKDSLEFFSNGAVRDIEGDYVIKCDNVCRRAAKHTPGPWVVDDRHIHPAKGLTYPPGVEPETDVILLVDTDQHDNGLLNETDKANLSLAAAAPELLEALKSLASAAARIIEDDDKPKLVHMTELNRQRRSACEIIAKAEGQTEKCQQCGDELKPHEHKTCFSCTELENNRRYRLHHKLGEYRD